MSRHMFILQLVFEGCDRFYETKLYLFSLKWLKTWKGEIEILKEFSSGQRKLLLVSMDS